MRSRNRDFWPISAFIAKISIAGKRRNEGRRLIPRLAENLFLRGAALRARSSLHREEQFPNLAFVPPAEIADSLRNLLDTVRLTRELLQPVRTDSFELSECPIVRPVQSASHQRQSR